MTTIGRNAGLAKFVILGAAAYALATVGASAQEPSLLATEAKGILPLQGERTLALEGLSGKIGLRIGKPGEIRFVSVARDDAEVEVPLEVWQDGRTVRLRFPAGRDLAPIRVEATVPSGIDLEISNCGPEVSVMNVDGDLSVAGSRIDLQAVGIGGSVSLGLVDATLRLDGVGKAVDLDLQRVTGSVTRVQGGAVVHIRESRLVVDGLTGEVDLDADRSEVHLGQVRGQVRATARGGRLELDTVDGGARLNLERSPLALEAVKGDVQIETDGDVRFENCAADLHVNSYGGSFGGTGNEGLIEVKTDGASVTIENNTGPVRVEGDSLRVSLTQIGGEVWVFTTSSELVLENLSTSARIENDFGDVTVTGVAGRLELVSRDGNVRVTAQNGPVLLKADGDEVEVAWVSLAWTEDSKIENERGDVTVILPRQGGCTLSAESKYGGVESEIDEIEIAGDGTSASAVLRRQVRPRLEVVAAGAVRFLPAQGGDAAAQ